MDGRDVKRRNHNMDGKDVKGETMPSKKDLSLGRSKTKLLNRWIQMQKGLQRTIPYYLYADFLPLAGRDLTSIEERRN